MPPRSLLFAVPHQIGTLQNALSIFSKYGVNLTKIESRPNTSKLIQNFQSPSDGGFPKVAGGQRVYDFFVEVEASVPQENVESAIQELMQQKVSVDVTFIGGDKIPWFPRKIAEMDLFAKKCLEAGGELESDHPGFNDKEYRARREYIAEIAKNYKHGEPIPRVQYTKSEIETWGVIFDKLTSLYPKYACKELNYVFPLLQANCGYHRNNVPQLQDVSNFLKDTTGFQVRPVAGLLSIRDFLNGLAFRVFHSTQYVRHHTQPLYTPEPDIVHDIIGHVPLFADADFADFSQEIGLASLGASDEDIEKLGTLYWFTVEFGLCKQDGQNKAYGAGLLSSFGELEYCMSDKPEFRPFDPFKACIQKYPITTYQPVYYVADSFERMKEQMKQYSESLQRPFSVRYNALTQSIEVMNDRRKIIQYVKTIKNHVSQLQSALERIKSLDNVGEFEFEQKAE